MRVTSKGQVTIPLHLREKAGIGPGTEVEFRQAKDGRIYVQRATQQSRAKELVDRMVGRGQIKMTTDEILALTRGDR